MTTTFDEWWKTGRSLVAGWTSPVVARAAWDAATAAERERHAELGRHLRAFVLVLRMYGQNDFAKELDAIALRFYGPAPTIRSTP